MSFVDPIFNWLLNFHPLIAILIISIIFGAITTLVYKFASNQKKIKELKDKQKSLQKKIKEIPKTEPEKIMKLNSEMMKISGPLMKETFKPTMWTLIPSLLILTWMAANLAYASISPGSVFSITAEFNEGVTGDITMIIEPEQGIEYINDENQIISNNSIAVWNLKALKNGEYNLLFKFHELEINKELLITEQWDYIEPELFVKQQGLKSIVVNHNKIKPFQGAPIIGGLNWLWSYIILTMIFTTLLRKLMKIY